MPDAAKASEPLEIESLDQEGRGVARRDGKTIFVEGALPGERVTASVYRRKPTFELATARAVLKSSASRVVPPCSYFGTCGGCALQHLDESAQVAVKQRVLEDALWHIGKVRAAADAFGHPRTGLALSPSRAIHGQARAEKRRDARRLPREAQQLRGGHDELPSRARAYFLAASEAACAHRGAFDLPPRAAGRAFRGRRRGRAGVPGSRAALVSR